MTPVLKVTSQRGRIKASLDLTNGEISPVSLSASVTTFFQMLFDNYEYSIIKIPLFIEPLNSMIGADISIMTLDAQEKLNNLFHLIQAIIDKDHNTFIKAELVTMFMVLFFQHLEPDYNHFADIVTFQPSISEEGRIVAKNLKQDIEDRVKFRQLTTDVLSADYVIKQDHPEAQFIQIVRNQYLRIQFIGLKSHLITISCAQLRQMYIQSLAQARVNGNSELSSTFNELLNKMRLFFNSLDCDVLFILD